MFYASESSTNIVVFNLSILLGSYDQNLVAWPIICQKMMYNVLSLSLVHTKGQILLGKILCL